MKRVSWKFTDDNAAESKIIVPSPFPDWPTVETSNHSGVITGIKLYGNLIYAHITIFFAEVAAGWLYDAPNESTFEDELNWVFVHELVHSFGILHSSEGWDWV
jgi:hypothetical protein